jgi:hypothetical protein
MSNLKGDSAIHGVPGVFGENTAGGDGVFGNGGDNGRGVVGVSAKHVGVEGSTRSSIAVFGGVSDTGNGRGVVGVAYTNVGVEGNSTSGAGIWGSSQKGEGVHGESSSDVLAAVAGVQLNNRSTGAGIYGEHKGNGPAGYFKGDVVVTGDIRLANADCAEDFDIADADLIEPGTVMVLGDEGGLHQSHQPYDKRVAGVISGAGDYKPGIVLDKQKSQRNRQPVALLGKVYCKVDAQYTSIEVGDMLTTSATPGHAMKAGEPYQAFGAVIGKALRPLKYGQGLIPILVTLQ